MTTFYPVLSSLRHRLRKGQLSCTNTLSAKFSLKSRRKTNTLHMWANNIMRVSRFKAKVPSDIKFVNGKT